MATIDPSLFRKAAMEFAAQSNAINAMSLSNVTDPFNQDTSGVFSSTWPAFTTVELLLLFVLYLFTFIARHTRVFDVTGEIISEKGAKNNGVSIATFGWTTMPLLWGARAVLTLGVHLTLPFAVYSVLVLFSPQFAETFQYTLRRPSNNIDIPACVYSTLITFILWLVVSSEALLASKSRKGRKMTYIFFAVLRLCLAAAIAICVCVATKSMLDQNLYPNMTPPMATTLSVGFAFAIIAVVVEGISTGLEIIVASKK